MFAFQCSTALQSLPFLLSSLSEGSVRSSGEVPDGYDLIFILSWNIAGWKVKNPNTNFLYCIVALCPFPRNFNYGCSIYSWTYSTIT